MLSDAQAILVQISGGPGMTLTEVEIVMQELNRHVEDHTQILFGTSVDNRMGNRMSVTIITSLSAESATQPVPRPSRRAEPRPDFVEKPTPAVPNAPPRPPPPRIIEEEPPVVPNIVEFTQQEEPAKPVAEASFVRVEEKRSDRTGATSTTTAARAGEEGEKVIR
jgi:cell division protein FtsZ